MSVYSTPETTTISPPKKNPWTWIPSLYMAEGIPYVIVISVAVIMFKRLGISNTDTAWYTSWLYLPWVVKPLWSPFVDILKSKRWWVTTMQFAIGIGLGGVALSLSGNHFFSYSLAFFCLVAFCSATHDIAADGFYMIGLNSREQAYFIGIRNTFYRIATIVGQGGIVFLAGQLEKKMPVTSAWSVAMITLTVLFFLFFVYHLFMLPKNFSDTPIAPTSSVVQEFFRTFVSFFKKEQIGVALAFMLLFRLGESQLIKLASPFMLDERNTGGLGIDTSTVGFIYGTIGVIALMLGGILGGIAVARNGLKHWIWKMTLAMNLPNLIYVWLAFAQPENLLLISSGVALEQFGYGFGFTGYMYYLIHFSKGPHKTAHYALCTGFMALGMMIPGMISGWIQDHIHYQYFFLWVILCSVPGFLVVKYLKIPERSV